MNTHKNIFAKIQNAPNSRFSDLDLPYTEMSKVRDLETAGAIEFEIIGSEYVYRHLEDWSWLFAVRCWFSAMKRG
jgi:hypothetical protein